MANELFHYRLDGDRGTIKIPKFKNVPSGVPRRLRKSTPDDQMWGMIEAVASKKALELIDALGMNELEAFTEAWMKDSGVSLGESGDS